MNTPDEIFDAAARRAARAVRADIDQIIDVDDEWQRFLARRDGLGTDGLVTVSARRRPPSTSRPWVLTAAAAAVTVMVVGGIAVLTGGRDSQISRPGNELPTVVAPGANGVGGGGSGTATVHGTASEGTAGGGRPAGEAPAGETPVGETPAGGVQVSGTAVSGALTGTVARGTAVNSSGAGDSRGTGEDARLGSIAVAADGEAAAVRAWIGVQRVIMLDGSAVSVALPNRVVNLVKPDDAGVDFVDGFVVYTLPGGFGGSGASGTSSPEVHVIDPDSGTTVCTTTGRVYRMRAGSQPGTWIATVGRVRQPDQPDQSGQPGHTDQSGQPVDAVSAVDVDCASGNEVPVAPLETIEEGGGTILFAAGRHVFSSRYDAEGNAQVFNADGRDINGGDSAGYHTFSHDGSSVAYGVMSTGAFGGSPHATNVIRVRDTADGALRWEATVPGGTLQDMWWVAERLVVEVAADPNDPNAARALVVLSDVDGTVSGTTPVTGEVLHIDDDPPAGSEVAPTPLDASPGSGPTGSTPDTTPDTTLDTTLGTTPDTTLGTTPDTALGTTPDTALETPRSPGGATTPGSVGLVPPAATCVSATSMTINAHAANNRAEVVLLQRRLEALGYDVGDVDGYLGQATLSAAISESLDHEVTPTGDLNTDDGVIGPRTIERLGIACTTPMQTAAVCVTVPEIPKLMADVRRAEVSMIQLTIRRAGFDPGTIDGYYGPDTVAGLQQLLRQQYPQLIGSLDPVSGRFDQAGLDGIGVSCQR